MKRVFLKLSQPDYLTQSEQVTPMKVVQISSHKDYKPVFYRSVAAMVRDKQKLLNLAHHSIKETIHLLSSQENARRLLESIDQVNLIIKDKDNES